MLSVLAAYLSLVSGVVSPRENRIAFYHALLQVREGWSKDQVRSLLGHPDDVWRSAERVPCELNDDTSEVWAYGTDGHLTIPTLGWVQFEGDRVRWQPAWPQDPPPPMSAISDEEMDLYLRTLGKWFGDLESPIDLDPLLLIRIANSLKPLGKDKALAILTQYDRLTLIRNDFLIDEYLFWAVRLIFRPKEPGGYFACHVIGMAIPPPPEDMRQWPDYPLVEAGGVPFIGFLTYRIQGGYETFDRYVQRDSANWVVDSAPIVPPTDPFVAYREVVKTPIWARIKAESREWSGGTIDWDGLLFGQLLRLVKMAGRPSARYADPAQFDRYHAAFLSQHHEWDRPRQEYVVLIHLKRLPWNPAPRDHLGGHRLGN